LALARFAEIALLLARLPLGVGAVLGGVGTLDVRCWVHGVVSRAPTHGEVVLDLPVSGTPGKRLNAWAGLYPPANRLLASDRRPALRAALSRKNLPIVFPSEFAGKISVPKI
jgi:hypothetical protein